MCIVRMIVILKRTIEGEVELETSKNILSIFSIGRSLYIWAEFEFPYKIAKIYKKVLRGSVF